MECGEYARSPFHDISINNRRSVNLRLLATPRELGMLTLRDSGRVERGTYNAARLCDNITGKRTWWYYRTD